MDEEEQRPVGRTCGPERGEPGNIQGETCGWGMASSVRSATTVKELAYIVNVVSYFVKKVA
jgi:hypothetical protein